MDKKSISIIGAGIAGKTFMLVYIAADYEYWKGLSQAAAFPRRHCPAATSFSSFAGGIKSHSW
jgi:hypothetical protein